MNWKKLFQSSSEVQKLKTRSQSTSLFKKAVISAMVISSLSFTVISSSADSPLKTVFHVYLNNEFIGTVSDKKVIEDLVNTKVSDMKEKYKDYNIELANNITYIPEQVFRPLVEDEETTKKVESLITIEAEATSIEINDQPLLYVKNLTDANKVIEKIKLNYVSKKELAKLDNRKSSMETLPPLKKNQTRLLDVKINEKVSLQNTEIDPSNILTVDQAAKFLLKGTLNEKKYLIKEGDVLGSIATKHNLDTKQLMKLNPGLKEDTLLQIGKELNIIVNEPLIHVVVLKETYKLKTLSYKKEVIKDSSMYKGDTKVRQKGQNGKSRLTYLITEKNGQQTKKNVKAEKVISKPVKYIVVEGTKVTPSRGTGHFTWPAVGGYVSSQVGHRWGKMHKGIDIARPSNKSIKAADNGVVVSAGWDGGYGNKIVIDHNNGLRTVYAHLSSINVSAGQTVAKGANIGVMGATGDATGVHLHFEVYKNGSLQNPLNYY
ncbi:peptidoglycan DD-metalloendopeptidase family protein [Heyndrickxia sp. NPDC080065]|uniref:peptidoglycan DD-metalloendopeptidase family protein n=1 Tax=Heyndrickxia sp. NPDC080065 TaxID=3390568 RepID=UPI003D0491D9